VAKLVARQLATAALHSMFEFRHPSKIINGRHKQRSLARQKNIQKTRETISDEAFAYISYRSTVLSKQLTFVTSKASEAFY